MSLLTVVPLRRTIPGVEQFDYEITDGLDVEVGDLIEVPLRRLLIPALVVDKPAKSAYAGRLTTILDLKRYARFGPLLPKLLDSSAQQLFSSKPSTLLAFLRELPKKALEIHVARSSQGSFAFETASTSLWRAAPWNLEEGLINQAKTATGRKLILTPWKHRAETLAEHVGGITLLSEDTPTAWWNTLRDFLSQDSETIVSTRIGSWLALFADAVFIDEPEHDDHKQDELSPRYDARWIVQEAQRLRPIIAIHRFGRTPSLAETSAWSITPTIPAEVHFQIWKPQRRSPIEFLSPQTIEAMEEATGQQRPIWIIHPIRGTMARFRCRDCGWVAPCPSCQFPLSAYGSEALCKQCGKKSHPPDACPTCGGTDFSRSLAGIETLQKQIREIYPHMSSATVVDFFQFDDLASRQISPPPLIVITDLALCATGEDLRRQEHLIFTWRRIADQAAALNATFIVQGEEQLLGRASAWLTSEGLQAAWRQEFADREAFGFPPATRWIKLIFDQHLAEIEPILAPLRSNLPDSWTLTEPQEIRYRPSARGARFLVFLITPSDVADEQLQPLLRPLVRKALIDLKPEQYEK